MIVDIRDYYLHNDITEPFNKLALPFLQFGA